MTSRQRVFGLGVLWLVAVWCIALLVPHVAPWMAGPNVFAYDVARRATPLARWDSGWYVNLAEAGYGAPPERIGQETNHAFFPLYPGLMRLLIRTTGIETSAAGNLVSAAALLAALLLFATFVRDRFGEARVLPAALVLLLFPTSFFLAAVYTEALALALALAATVSLERGRTLLGAAAGLLVGLTRVTGVVLAPYLALVSWRRDAAAGLPPARRAARALLAGLSPLAGFGLFCLYLGRRFGDPLLFFTAQHNWSGQAKSILDGPRLLARAIAEDVTAGRLLAAAPARTLEGIYLLLFAALAVALFRRGRHPEALYVALTVGIVVLTGTSESAGRYVLLAFPAFGALGGLAERPSFFRTLLALSACAGVVYVWAFVHGYWAG